LVYFREYINTPFVFPRLSTSLRLDSPLITSSPPFLLPSLPQPSLVHLPLSLSLSIGLQALFFHQSCTTLICIGFPLLLFFVLSSLRASVLIVFSHASSVDFPPNLSFFVSATSYLGSLSVIVFFLLSILSAIHLIDSLGKKGRREAEVDATDQGARDPTKQKVGREAGDHPKPSYSIKPSSILAAEKVSKPILSRPNESSRVCNPFEVRTFISDSP